jgi:hypothetical protein
MAGSDLGTQRLVSYLVSSTPSGNARVSTRLRFTQVSKSVKNGVPPPTRTGWVTIAYSSISRPAWPPRRGWRRRFHGAAVLGFEPGDLGDRVAGEQTGVPVRFAGRRGEHHLRHVPPAAGELDSW